jgi:lipid-binding SYLF domain-containing protein
MTTERVTSGRTVWACIAALIMSLTCWTVDARTQTAQRATSDAAADAAEEAREATEALRRVMSHAENAVPPSVLEQAKAVAVFDNVVQAAFIAGGRGGDGVVSARHGGAWTVPAFFRMGGASVGAQIGARRTDIVLVFTTEKALKSLLDDRLEFGAEVKAVAGPNAREAASAASTAADDGLLVYTRDRGLFAGVALDGAVITPNNDLNRAVYGLVAREILTGSAPSRSPDTVQTFLETLTRYAAGRS